MQYIAKSDLDNNKFNLTKALRRKRSYFAHEMMLAEFSMLGHLHDEQWATFRDTLPAKLANRRECVLWGGGLF